MYNTQGNKCTIRVSDQKKIYVECAETSRRIIVDNENYRGMSTQEDIKYGI